MKTPKLSQSPNGSEFSGSKLQLSSGGEEEVEMQMRMLKAGRITSAQHDEIRLLTERLENLNQTEDYFTKNPDD